MGASEGRRKNIVYLLTASGSESAWDHSSYYKIHRKVHGVQVASSWLLIPLGKTVEIPTAKKNFSKESKLKIPAKFT